VNSIRHNHSVSFSNHYLTKPVDAIDFEDQYSNLAVYTPQAVGLWGYEIVGAFSVRLFRWLTDIPDQVICGPYENPDESPQEFRIRFEREFWAAIEALKQ